MAEVPLGRRGQICRRRYPGEVWTDAFHITAAANWDSIAAEGFRTDRRGVLGTGAYFDLGSEATGWAPARQRYPGQPLVVLRCIIEAGQVLDLDDPEVRSRFRQFQRQLVQQLGRQGALRLGQGGHVDRFIALLEAEGERVDTVKRTFQTDGLTRVAVRDSSRIRVLSIKKESGEETPWPPPNS